MNQLAGDTSLSNADSATEGDEGSGMPTGRKRMSTLDIRDCRFRVPWLLTDARTGSNILSKDSISSQVKKQTRVTVLDSQNAIASRNEKVAFGLEIRHGS
mmetsp:Transcript_8726/g.15816  ORF Transcript_8726/g.15816 Transcript_8726/m.15816 type:complete len:100 (+) Transcript_8726:239-538(+)